MYLTDLTFIEDGHPDFLPPPNDNLINFVKYQQLSVVIQEMQQYQQKKYYFEKVEPIQFFLSKLKIHTEDKLYEQSLKLEPRGS